MKFYLWIFILIPALSFAEPLTIERLVASVDEETSLKTLNEKSKILKSRSSTKLWNSLEFQYKLDGFGFMSHDFELKFKPKDFGEGSSTEEYWKAQSEYQKSKLAFERSFLIYERYERALRYVTTARVQKLHQEMFDVNKDRLEVLHIKSGSETFTPTDLINALEREADLRAEVISDSNSMVDIASKFKTWLDFDSIAIDSTFLPSIEEIESELKSAGDVNESYPSVDVAKQKWNIAEKRYTQERVGSRRVISSIGVGYKYERGSYEYDSVKTGTYTYDYENKVGIADKEWKIIRKPDDRRTRDKFYAEITLRLPFFGRDGGDETKRQLDVLDAKSDYLEELRSITQKVARIKEETLALIAQRNVQKDLASRVNAGELFEEFAERSGSDPLLLLRAKDVSLESDLQAVKLEYEIYSRYLVILDYAGKLSNGLRLQ